MVTVVPSSEASMPSAWTQPRVEWQSAPVEKLEIRVVPSASEAIMAKRCEIDLSPGRDSTPERRPEGRMVCCMKPYCKSSGFVPVQRWIHRRRHFGHVEATTEEVAHSSGDSGRVSDCIAIGNG